MAPMVLGGIKSSLNQVLNISFGERLIVRKKKKEKKKRWDVIVKMNFNVHVYMWKEKWRRGCCT